MHPTRSQHQLRRFASRGFSLFEIVVAVAIIAMLSAGISVAVLVINERQRVKLTRTNAELLRGGVKLWRVLGNDSTACPTVPMLIADGVLDRGKSATEDAWGQRWRIQCDERDATITSLGPDRVLGTEDDIRVPPA